MKKNSPILIMLFNKWKAFFHTAFPHTLATTPPADAANILNEDEIRLKLNCEKIMRLIAELDVSPEKDQLPLLLKLLDYCEEESDTLSKIDIETPLFSLVKANHLPALALLYMESSALLTLYKNVLENVFKEDSLSENTLQEGLNEMDLALHKLHKNNPLVFYQNAQDLTADVQVLVSFLHEFSTVEGRSSTKIHGVLYHPEVHRASGGKTRAEKAEETLKIIIGQYIVNFRIATLKNDLTNFFKNITPRSNSACVEGRLRSNNEWCENRGYYNEGNVSLAFPTWAKILGEMDEKISAEPNLSPEKIIEPVLKNLVSAFTSEFDNEYQQYGADIISGKNFYRLVMERIPENLANKKKIQDVVNNFLIDIIAINLAEADNNQAGSSNALVSMQPPALHFSAFFNFTAGLGTRPDVLAQQSVHNAYNFMSFFEKNSLSDQELLNFLKVFLEKLEKISAEKLKFILFRLEKSGKNILSLTAEKGYPLTVDFLVREIAKIISKEPSHDMRVLLLRKLYYRDNKLENSPAYMVKREIKSLHDKIGRLRREQAPDTDNTAEIKALVSKTKTCLETLLLLINSGCIQLLAPNEIQRFYFHLELCKTLVFPEPLTKKWDGEEILERIIHSALPVEYWFTLYSAAIRDSDDLFFTAKLLYLLRGLLPHITNTKNINTQPWYNTINMPLDTNKVHEDLNGTLLSLHKVELYLRGIVDYRSTSMRYFLYTLSNRSTVVGILTSLIALAIIALYVWGLVKTFTHWHDDLVPELNAMHNALEQFCTLAGGSLYDPFNVDTCLQSNRQAFCDSCIPYTRNDTECREVFDEQCMSLRSVSNTAKGYLALGILLTIFSTIFIPLLTSMFNLIIQVTADRVMEPLRENFIPTILLNAEKNRAQMEEELRDFLSALKMQSFSLPRDILNFLDAKEPVSVSQLLRLTQQTNVLLQQYAHELDYAGIIPLEVTTFSAPVYVPPERSAASASSATILNRWWRRDKVAPAELTGVLIDQAPSDDDVYYDAVETTPLLRS